MNFTMTRTVAESFTLTHSKYLASKVTSDMWRCQQLYGSPSADAINNYGTELAILMRDGYVSEYEYGFQSEGQRVISWRYTIVGSSVEGGDDRPGKIVSGASISTASFFNRLTHSDAWFKLSETDRKKIEGDLPVQRVAREGPIDGAGYWQQDRHYSTNGVSMPRSTFRPHNI